jgi:hypothetical protein
MLYRRIEISITILSITWKASSMFPVLVALIIPPRNLRPVPRRRLMLRSAIPNLC